MALPSSSGVGSAFRARAGRPLAGATLVVRAVVVSVVVGAGVAARDGAVLTVRAVVAAPGAVALRVSTVVVSTVACAGATPRAVAARAGAVVTMVVGSAVTPRVGAGRARVRAVLRDGVHPRVEIPALAGSTSPVVVAGTITVSTRVGVRREGTATVP
ncbi:MAG TPA: hypothetical protein VK420_16170, partial [Longimicrobium sp.]|nr:hypothetical protein [Longimicrobium sp.]